MLASNPLRNSRSETITGATLSSPLLPDTSQTQRVPKLRNPQFLLTHPLQRERDSFPMPHKTQRPNLRKSSHRAEPLLMGLQNRRGFIHRFCYRAAEI